LVCLATRQCGDPLHEIKDALGLAPLFVQHRFDDLRGFRFREAALAQEAIAVLVAAGDDPLARGPRFMQTARR